MIENTNTKQFYPGPILNNTLEITDFLFNDAEQIKIKHSKLNEEGILVDVDLNYPTDYEVTKVLPSDINAAEAALTASTGQIMLKNINVLAGEKLTVYRVSQIIQDKDYPRTGAFPAATHEGALDYLTMQNQEQKDEIDRALKVPVSTEGFNGSLPVPIPSRALKINNNGTGFEMSEFDPDLALITTEEFKNQAQQAAIEALSSQTAAANSETIAIQQSQNATAQAEEAKYYATLTKEKVSKSGDTMTGVLYIEGGTNTHIKQVSTEIKSGVIPAEHQYINFSLLDKEQVKLGELYYRQGNDGSHYIALGDYQGTTKRYLQVGENANGTPYFAFPMCTAKATTTSSASSTLPAVVVKNYKNGTSWYRVWSDGWIEQGGRVTVNSKSGATVTFPKTFSDTNYSLATAIGSSTGGDYSFNITADVGYTTFSASKFSVDNFELGQKLKVCWIACGY